MAKKRILFFVLMIGLPLLLAALDPIAPVYGGTIWITNNSSHNLFMEFYTENLTDTIESMICVEKQERLQIGHSVEGDYDKENADPNVYFKHIKIYDMDTGLLLKDLQVSANTFNLDKGSLTTASGNAESSFVITDTLF
ncbi:hypothetical protein AGMMS50267_12580 [Spirochaetia bacterium]|nr:hypothetical protein AGMMS50267_12580 [Spirochaetia bacterium]